LPIPPRTTQLQRYENLFKRNQEKKPRREDFSTEGNKIASNLIKLRDLGGITITGLVPQGEKAIATEDEETQRLLKLRLKALAESQSGSAIMSSSSSTSSPTASTGEALNNTARPSTLYDHLRSSLTPLAGQAGELGDAEDLKLHRTLDRSFAKRLDKSSERVLNLARNLIQAVDSSRNAASGKNTAGRVKQKLQEEDDVVHEFTPNVQDTVDGLLEATVSLNMILSLRSAVSLDHRRRRKLI
jgi:hypothetical protein